MYTTVHKWRSKVTFGLYSPFTFTWEVNFYSLPGAGRISLGLHGKSPSMPSHFTGSRTLYFMNSFPEVLEDHEAFPMGVNYEDGWPVGSDYPSLSVL